MPIGYTIEADAKPVLRAFEGLARIGADLRPVLGQIGLYVRRGAQRRLRGRRSDWGPTRGMLGKSLTVQVDARSVRVGSALIYAAVQQLGTDGLPGGAITPKPPRKYLAIPATKALRMRGVFPRDLSDDEIKFVKVADIHIGRRHWKGPALVNPESGDVMFALVRQVRIKGRPYLLFDQAEQAFALTTISRAYQRAWNKSTGRGN
jgi:phage gpG-like protein